jgi:hypothetical protein
VRDRTFYCRRKKGRADACAPAGAVNIEAGNRPRAFVINGVRGAELRRALEADEL